MRLSFNVNGQRIGNKSYFLDRIKNMNLNQILIMDNIQLANEVYELNNGKTRVDHRTWHALDGEWWNPNSPNYFPPKDYVSYATTDGLKHIGRYILNEPKGSTPLGWLDLLDWLIEVSYRLADLGYHAVVGNIGPATWEPEDVENGLFDGYLTMLSDLDSLGFRGGWHIYTGILLPFGVSQWPLEYALDRTKVQIWPRDLPQKRFIYKPDNVEYKHWLNYWDRLNDSAKQRIEAYGELPRYWHIRRTDWFDIRAREIGVKVHRKISTETGHDRMGDFGNIYEILKNRFGVPAPYNTIRGPMTLRNVWNYYFPELSFDEVWMSQALWLDEVMPDDFVAFDFFSWTKDAPDWDKQFGFNLEARTGIHDLLIEYAVDQPQPEPEEPPMGEDPDNLYQAVLPALLSVVDQTEMRLRSKESTGKDSSVLAVVPHGAKVLAWKPKSPRKFGDYYWCMVEYEGIRGYMAILTKTFEKQFLALPEMPHSGDDNTEAKVEITVLLKEVIEKVHAL